MPGAAGFIGCPRYATLVRRGGRRAQYQIRYWEATQREGSKAESRAQMQVRVQVLVQVGRGTSRIRHRGGGEETRKRGGDVEKSEAAKTPWGWAEPRGVSRNRQNSKWVFEEAKAETRLVSHGGRGEVGEL